MDDKLKKNSNFTYDKAGVDINQTDTLKREISAFVAGGDSRVLNKLGPFASLYDIKFDNLAHPVLALKSEEPGSKQKLAIKYGFSESISHDMINHLVNDIIVMGAKPLAVLDTIVCGSADSEVIKSIVKGVSDACRNNECTLVGGETSVQPGVVGDGTYILTASIAGIVDKEDIIDGSAIQNGDIILAVASNGLHTNGYSLVRMLMDETPDINQRTVGEDSFIEAIMKPHTAYYSVVKDLFVNKGLKGMAHITGGGIEGNLRRIIPDGLYAAVDLSKIKALPIFGYIKKVGDISDEEMLKTFNCGVGLILVVSPEYLVDASAHISKHCDCYPLGEIRYCAATQMMRSVSADTGSGKVVFENSINWAARD